jgi:hypothetical protein
MVSGCGEGHMTTDTFYPKPSREKNKKMAGRVAVP